MDQTGEQCDFVKIFDGAGHWIQQEKPAEVNELLLKFIEQDDSFENQAAKLLLLKCISNRVELARKLMTKDKWFRERIMAENLEWILNTVGKNKKVIIYPISFIIDNSETVFELNVEYRELAEKLGIKEYKVCKCVNDSNTFVEAIKEIISL